MAHIPGGVWRVSPSVSAVPSPLRPLPAWGPHLEASQPQSRGVPAVMGEAPSYPQDTWLALSPRQPGCER